MTTRTRPATRSALPPTVFFLWLPLLVGCEAAHEPPAPGNPSPDPGLATATSLNLAEESTIVLGEDSDLNLNWPLSVRRAPNGDILWAQHNSPLYVFTAAGQFVRTIGRYGEGPAEFVSVTDLAIDGRGNLHVFDAVQKRVTVFDPTYELLSSYEVVVDNCQHMTVDGDGNAYLLRQDVAKRRAPAVIVVDSSGAATGGWGEIPDSAYLQVALVGGGIASDREGNVYYSYMADHRLWKVSPAAPQPEVFRHKPGYFREAGERRAKKLFEESVQSRSPQKLLRYAFEVSRVQNLISAPSGLLFQQIADGPRHSPRFYIEVWTTDGRKVSSALEPPGFLIFADASHLTFLETEMDLDWKPRLLVYRYTMAS